MANKTIGSLPSITSLDDTSYIPAEQQGSAVKVSGLQFKQFAQASVSQYVQAAQQAAEQAQSAVSQVDGKVQQAEQAAEDAQEAVGQIGTAVEDTLANAQVAQSAKDDAESAAETAGEYLKTVQGYAETAQSAAESVTGVAENAEESAQAADASAQQAQTAAETAAQDAEDAESAATTAIQAKEAIENLDVASETLEPDENVDVVKSVSEQGVVTLTFKVPRGQRGLTGSSVVRSERTSGNGAPGTTDTWTLYDQGDNPVGFFTVYNGIDGIGSGDMTKAVYDPTGKNQDIFLYADQKISALKQEILGMNILIAQGEGE